MSIDEQAVPDADIADVIEQQIDADRDDGQDEYPHQDRSTDDDETPLVGDSIEPGRQ